MGRWWPATHSVGASPLRDVVIEPATGGRWFGRLEDGSEAEWGKVLAWEPPARLLLDWQIGEARGTEVEVTFEPEGPGSRVVLEHRGFSASDPRERYSGGWDVVLGTYVESASKKA